MSPNRGVRLLGVLRHELAGVALLQWPWSARAMDEAAAALDALGPAAALTYAEAGGWGRAIMLECRRRGIPTAGLQHGFIYRHWLNYLHEPTRSTATQSTRPTPGSRLPSVTLLFDAYAERHLTRGRPLPETDAARHRQPTTRRPRSLDAQPFARRSGPRARRDRAHVSQTPWSWSRPSGRKRGRSCPSSCMRPPACPVFASRSKRIRPKHPMRTCMAAQRCSNVTILPAAAPLAPLLAEQPGGRHRQLHGRTRCRRARGPRARDRPAKQLVPFRRGRNDGG